MKSEDAPTVISISSTTTATINNTSSSGVVRRESWEIGGVLLSWFVGKSRYKLWVIGVILLLAFWSMFTGSLSLKWSTGNVSILSDKLEFPLDDDLDILEVEEKEKVVRHMWDLYLQSPSGSNRLLPRFWQEAFQAAYESLASDVLSVREAAISEIAKLFIRSLYIDPRPLDHSSTPTKKTNHNSKKPEHTKSTNSV